MNRSRLAPILVLAAAAVAGGPATAQTQRPDREDATAVSPVTVMPRTAPPRVTATYPAQGQAIAPGAVILKVAFDQPMRPEAWDYAAASAAEGERPECLETPRLLPDARTFLLLCRVLPGRTYAVALNGGPAGGFSNLAENRAVPLVLSFATTRGDPVTSLARAMTAAGLRDDESPIQDAPRIAPAIPPAPR